MEQTTLREGCLNEAVLQAFCAGQLPVEDLGRVDEHLDSCLECQSVFMKLAAELFDRTGRKTTPFAQQFASQGERKSPPRTRFKSIVGEMALGHPPTRGGAVGRYLVLDLLGAGSMGAVYAAYDPQLDRKVAIKVLRPDRQPGTRADKPESGLKGAMASDKALRGRLLKEGQALARLSHPNVTSIYDVGVVDGRVFIAMEFVEGQTLQRWLSQRQRSWKEILQIYLKAGEGLAAAHAAGLVHRDFKPEKVMVGRDGRVRVTDFGLVRIAASDSGDGSEMNEERASLRDRSPAPAPKQDLSSTQPGTLVGTPAYMAPEQFSGKAADARSDQFSFCVALFEALYGKRPFAGKSTAQMAKSTLEGRVEEVAANKVPWRIHRTLLKGLAVSPEDRFASIDALLRELAKEPAARWRWAPPERVILA